MTYQYFGILLIGATVPAIGWAIAHSPKLLVPALLAFCFVLSWLGFLYFWEHEEIHLVARYLKFYVRPRVRVLMGNEDWWGWEEYKEESRKQVGKPGLFKNVFLDRCLLFIFPSLLSWAAIIVLARKGSSDWLKWYPSWAFVALLMVFFLLDSAVLFKLVWTTLRKGDMASRYLGAVVASKRGS